MTEAKLREYMQAWASRDVTMVMSLMTEDCVFHASGGPDVMGRTHSGQDEVRAAIETFFETFPKCEWDDVELLVAGDRGYSEWTLRATDASGQETEVRGCDLFEFRGNLVSVKNAFRKARPPR